jgi:hypothetical protein
MIPKTKAHIPPEIEQEMTIEPPGKNFFRVLVMGLALVLVSHLAGFPRLTKPETGQPPAQKAERMPDQLPDLSAGAEYQLRLSGGDFAMVDSREFAVVEELPDLVQDRAYHSRLSDLLSSRPTEKLKTDQLKAPEKQFGKDLGICRETGGKTTCYILVNLENLTD